MPDPYTLNKTAAQIDDILDAVFDADQAPASGATNMVNSNRIYIALQAEATARGVVEADVATLQGQVSDIQDAGYIEFSTSRSSDGYYTGGVVSSSVAGGVTANTTDCSLTVDATGFYTIAVGNTAITTTTSFSSATELHVNGTKVVDVLDVTGTGGTSGSVDGWSYPILLTASDVVRVYLNEGLGNVSSATFDNLFIYRIM